MLSVQVALVSSFSYFLSAILTTSSWSGPVVCSVPENDAWLW